MKPLLTFNQYGKTEVRLAQVLRSGPRHELAEISVAILFQGDFSRSYTDRDNSIVLPTDTMKNTVYVLARRNPISSIENFARIIAAHFLARVERLDEIQVGIEQSPWARIADSDSAFVLSGKERRITKLNATRSSERFTSGVHGLEILKTSHSAFAGFLRDEFTTLPDTYDRLLGTVLEADWSYGSGEIDFDAEYSATCLALLQTFADHASESVQDTLYAMAAAALEASRHLTEVHLVMPNKHRVLVDLAKFQLDNPNQIFVPIDAPSGYIEARVAKP